MQDPGNRKLRGPYEDELAAAKSIAKTLDVKLADLLRNPAPKSKVLNSILDGQEAVGKYKFVTKRVLRGKTYWVGQPKKGKQKMFAESVQAATWTAKQRKTTLKAMLKGKDLHRCQQYQHRLATIVQIYGSGSELPGDAAYLRQHARSMEAVVKEEPAMDILDVQSKYGPYRTHQTDIFKKTHSRSKVDGSKVLVEKMQREYRAVSQSRLEAIATDYGKGTLLRAYLLLAVLRNAAAAVQGQDFTCWITNCGRNVSHHSGFVPLLLRFKVVRKVPRSSASALDLGSVTGRRYMLRTDNLIEVLTKLCKLIRLADAIQKLLSKVRGPWSCSSWCRAFHDLQKVVKRNPCPGMQNSTSYIPLWTMRAILLRRMWATGAASLRLDDCLFKDFASTFPDQKAMLHKIVDYGLQRKQSKTCREVLHASNYKGPPELMSMYLCFLKAVDRTSTSFFNKNFDLLQKTRAEYKVQHHQNPVLRELIKIARAKLRSS